MRASAAGSWLAGRNPTVKVAVLLAVSLALLLLLHPLPVLVLYLLAWVAARLAARVPWRTLLIGQLPFLAFGVGLLSVNALSRPGEPLWPGSPASVEGLTVGVALALRGMVVGLLTIAFAASTPPRLLMVSLVEHARMSPRYAYALLAGHRMLESMPARWQTIRTAHAIRAPRRPDGRPRYRLVGPGGFAGSAFGLLVTSIRASDRIALALETRGLREGPRTIWRPAPLGPADLGLAIVVAAVVAVVVLGHAVAGG